MRTVRFPEPTWDLALEQAVYGHTWQPISAMQLSRYTGIRYNRVRDALWALRVQGLVTRRPYQGRRGRGWEWSRP